MKRGEWHPEARRLQAKGHTHKEIAAELGVTGSAVWKALNPEAAREQWARSNAKPGRREARIEAAKVSHAKPEYRGVCGRCGGLMGIGHRDNGICRTCRFVIADERARQIVEWWRDGLSMKEICARLGWSVGHLSMEMDRLRKRGYDLPYRYEAIRRRHREKVAA